jgi:hypothetical protein
MNKAMRVMVEQIARIALESSHISNHISYQLGLSDEELDKVYAELEKKLKEGV